MENTNSELIRENKWHKYFFEMADVVASRSKDITTKVGCVIVGQDHGVRATGYNGFPRDGHEDTHPERFERPEKYIWTEHAERNAFYSACRVGTPIFACDLYLNQMVPCTDCARAIIQVGIRNVYTKKLNIREHWRESFKKTLIMFDECGIGIWSPEIDPEFPGIIKLELF